MNTRQKYSVVLILLGLILAILPSTGGKSLTRNPVELSKAVFDTKAYLTADQLARMFAAEDTTLRFVDLRSSGDFKLSSLPGAVNLPYGAFIKSDPGSFLSDKAVKYILISSDGLEAGYALTLARGMNFDNTLVLNGGFNAWNETVLNSTFTGEVISARENALFEARTKAKRLFEEYNSLPDSIKVRFMKSVSGSAKKLDGGCE